MYRLVKLKDLGRGPVPPREKRIIAVREDIDFLDSTLMITQRRLFLKTHRAEVLLVIDFGKRFGVVRRRQFQRQKTNVLFKTLNRTSSPNSFWTF